MKKYIKDCRSALCTALVIMLVLSMMSGVFSLSASARGTDFPEVVNRPILTYADLKEMDGQNISDSNYDQPCVDTIWKNLYTISVVLDDSNAEKKVSSISKVTYTYTDGDVSFTDEAFYKTANSMGILLVDTPLNYHASHMVDGIPTSDKISSFYFATNYRTDREGFLRYLESLGRGKLVLNIYYENIAAPHTVDVDIVKSNVAMVVSPRKRFDEYNSVSVQLFSFPALQLNNKDLTNDFIAELDGAIKSLEKLDSDSANKFYVDIDSEKPVVLPMSDISAPAQLVQTRVGGNVVYNAQGSVDFGANAVEATAQEQAPYTGNIYKLPNGSYASDDDLTELHKLFYANGYTWYVGNFNGQIYELIPNHLPSIPNFKDGILIKKVDNYYTGIPGTDFDQESINNGKDYPLSYFRDQSEEPWRNTVKNSYSYSGGYLCQYRIWLKPHSNEKARELYNRLQSGTDFTEQEFHDFIGYSDGNSTYTNLCCGINLYGDRYSNNSSSSFYDNTWFYDDYLLGYSNSCFSHFEFNTRDSITYNTLLLPDETAYTFLNKLLVILDELEIEVENTNAYSYMPNIEALNTPKEEDTIKISDILDELGVEVVSGKNQIIVPYNSFYATTPINSNGNLNAYSYNSATQTQKLHETYELGVLGDFVTDTQRNTSGFVTDTLDDNGNITFNYDDVKDNVTKGKVYNVVNQIQIPVIDTTGNVFYENPRIWYNSDMNAVYDKSLGYTCIDSETGEKVVKNKGSVYYLGGDNIVSSNTAYITDGNSEYGILRNTEYKWGEIVFVSKPDSVQNLSFNSDAQTLTWTKPVDEGYGTTEGQTNTDDYIKVDEYIVKIKDSGGNVVLTKNVPRTQEDTVAFKIENLHLKNDNYTAEVTAKNVIGESVPAETPLDLRMPEVEITMTPDQPIYQINDTVTFSECVANTGRVPLTNVVVTQSVDGEYTAKNGVKINGNTAAIETLDIGQRVQLEYKTPASVEVMNVIRNTAEVTTNENASDSVSSTVTVIKPGLSMVTTADKDIYKDGDTVTLTTVVTNTGNEAIKDIEVKFDVESGKFTKCDTNTTKLSENDTTAMIGVLPVGESTTLTYEIKAENIETGKNAAAEIVSTAKTTDKKLTAASVVNFTVSRPDLTISANADEELVVYGDNVVYTVVVTNSGNCTLKNITVSSDSKGAFAENEAGSINKTGNFVLAELTEGKSVTLVYTVPAKNTAVGKFTSTFKANDDKNNSATDKAEAEVLNYKVNILKLTDDSEHYLGEDILFRGIVTNRGNYELNNITVIEDLKGRFELADGAKTAGDNVIVIDSLMPGESYTYDYYVTASEDIIKDGKITGTASADAGNNIKSSDMKSVTVYSPALTVEKTTDNETVYKVGDTVEWIDVITNTGDCTLNNVVVTENFIGRFDTTEYDTNGNTLNIPKLEAGDSVTVKYITDIRQGDLSSSTYTSKIYVSADEKISETAAASVKVTGPAFRITKYADKETYFPKDEIIFTDAIINVGDKKLTNVTVTEDLEGEFTRIGEGFKAKGNTIVIPEIDVGDSAVVYFSVNRDSLTEKTVTSIVTVTCDQEISDNADVTFTLADDTNTDSEKSNTDTTNTDSGMDNTDTSNTDSGMDNTDTSNTDSGMDNTDTSNTDSGKDNTDTSNTDSGKDNTDTRNTDSGKDNTDTSNTDSEKDNTDTSNTDSGKDNTDTSKQTDTDTSGKASNDQLDKESEDQPAKMLMGDVNLDNKITARDSLLIQRYAIGLESFNDLQLLLGDVSGNNKVSAGDALNILRYTVKLATQSSTGTLIDIPNDLRAYISK